MSLQFFSCEPEACGAGGGNPAVHGSVVSHDPGIGCGARRQDMLAEGWFALFILCVGSHNSSWGLW